MIQDLNGLHLDNQYQNVKPRKEDFIISLRDGMVMLSGEHDEIHFPTWGEVAQQGGERAEDNDEAKKVIEDTVYGFSIDGEKYFLSWNQELEGYRYEKLAYLRKGGPKKNLYAGLLARQIGRFYEALVYCGKCGHPMEHSDHERMMLCPHCGNHEYPKICPCVIVGIVHDGKILVSQYRNGFTDHYALIAGFAEVGETIEECVHREVYEETQLHVKNLKFYKSQPWPFSDSLLFGFFCELDGDDHIVIEEDELAMAKWAAPEDIYESFNDYSLTNEMLCKFREDYKEFGELRL